MQYYIHFLYFQDEKLQGKEGEGTQFLAMLISVQKSVYLDTKDKKGVIEAFFENMLTLKRYLPFDRYLVALLVKGDHLDVLLRPL